MMHRRGLTIIEVLASAALLTLIASACVPLLRDASRLTSRASGPDLDAIERLKSAVSDLEAVDFPSAAIGSVTIVLPDGSSARFTTTEAPGWYVLTSGACEIIVWIEQADAEEPMP